MGDDCCSNTFPVFFFLFVDMFRSEIAITLFFGHLSILSRLTEIIILEKFSRCMYADIFMSGSL
jgi:hypothetical protein